MIPYVGIWKLPHKKIHQDDDIEEPLARTTWVGRHQKGKTI